MLNRPTLELETAPVTEPVTLNEAKNFLRVDGTGDDTLITTLITTVREAAEQYLRSALITQSWKLSYDKYVPSKVLLPMGPVQSVTSVTSFARDGGSSVMQNNNYYLSAGNRNLVFDANPISHRVEIIYVAGYGDNASDVPNPVKQGVLHHLAQIYDGRTGGSTIPLQSQTLYAPYRQIRV